MLTVDCQPCPAVLAQLASLATSVALQLRADRGLSSARRQRAAAGERLPQHDEIVDAAVGRQMAVVGAVVLQELAHLVQPRVHPEADART